MGFFNSYNLNFAKLVGGTAGVQAIVFFTLPILTRMYSVSDFGLQALYMSIASLLIIVVTGRYELAILLPKDDEDSFSLIILVLVIAAIGCIVIEIVVFSEVSGWQKNCIARILYRGYSFCLLQFMYRLIITCGMHG